MLIASNSLLYGMTHELLLRRKWTLRSHGQQVVFIKNPNERAVHVLMKALIWALYLPDYPDASVEISIGDRYKPDVVSMHPPSMEKPGLLDEPRFWGEAGQVSVKKYRSLFKRFPDTHFAIGKWNTRLDPHLSIICDALDGTTRRAPVDLICFPEDSPTRFIDEQGNIDVAHEQLTWKRLS